MESHTDSLHVAWIFLAGLHSLAHTTSCRLTSTVLQVQELLKLRIPPSLAIIYLQCFCHESGSLRVHESVSPQSALYLKP